MFAFYNPNSKNINFIESNQSGVITTNHGVPIVKTNNVIVYDIRNIDQLIELDNPFKSAIVHINAQFINKDITFLDKFESLEEVLNNPYTLDLIINDQIVNSMMLTDSTNPLIVYNTCYAVNDCKSIRISSNYENLDVIKIQIIVEELLSSVKSVDFLLEQ